MAITKKELNERIAAYRTVLNTATDKLDDKEVSEVPNLLPSMKYDGTLIKNGTRILWNGIIKRAAVDLWATEQNNPDNAPNLWEDVMYRNGIRIIPKVITVGLAFAKDELGYWGEELYKSLIDNNVATPEAHANGWELQKGE